MRLSLRLLLAAALLGSAVSAAHDRSVATSGPGAEVRP